MLDCWNAGMLVHQNARRSTAGMLELEDAGSYAYCLLT